MKIQHKETKDVVIVKEQVSKASEVAKMTIKSDKDYEDANGKLANIRKVKQLVTAEKKKQLDPINEAARATREFWKPFEEQISNAENILKGSILNYKKKLEARNEKKEATISKKVEEGKLSFEKGVEKVGAIQQKPLTHSGIKTRKIKKVRITDETKVPKEYWVIDMVKLNADAKAGKEIPGVEVYEQDIVS